MRRSTIAIVLLLMLAIPFQGFAAAIQSGCALGHHRTGSGSSAPHSQDQHHDHAAMFAAAAQADANPDSETGTTLECKCGTCGPGTALPVSKTDTAHALPHAAPIGRFADPPVIMITGGPERPPRGLPA
jgi:hypothetical protein